MANMNDDSFVNVTEMPAIFNGKIPTLEELERMRAALDIAKARVELMREAARVEAEAEAQRVALSKERMTAEVEHMRVQIRFKKAMANSGDNSEGSRIHRSGKVPPPRQAHGAKTLAPIIHDSAAPGKAVLGAKPLSIVAMPATRIGTLDGVEKGVVDKEVTCEALGAAKGNLVRGMGIDGIGKTNKTDGKAVDKDAKEEGQGDATGEGKEAVCHGKARKGGSDDETAEQRVRRAPVRRARAEDFSKRAEVVAARGDTEKAMLLRARADRLFRLADGKPGGPAPRDIVASAKAKIAEKLSTEGKASKGGGLVALGMGEAPLAGLTPPERAIIRQGRAAMRAARAEDRKAGKASSKGEVCGGTGAAAGDAAAAVLI